MLPPLPFPPSFFFILFLSLFMIPTYFSSDHAEGYYYSACAPFSCGNLSDISYPFWYSNQPDYCGHPKFKVDCQQDNPTIDIMSQKFDIIGINQTTQIMKIARLDLWVDLSCSKDYTTFNLDFPFFNYTTNDDYTTLFYDCEPPSYYSSPMIDGAYSFTYTCSNNDHHYAYLVLNTNLGKNFISLGCKNNTTVPILKEAELNFIKGDITLGAKYVLNEGFEVGWMGVNEDQCDSCIKSSGRCGHKNASFICLCPNDDKTYDGGNICSISPSQSPLPALPYSMPSHQAAKQEPTTKYSNCTKPFKCGSLSPISFPFWDGQERPRYCGGRDEFKLNNCTDLYQHPFLHINSQQFQVLDIYTNYTMKMKMVRKDDDYETCDPPLSNNTLPLALFQYTQNVSNIIVFYNCAHDVSFEKNFTCLSNKSEHAYYVEEAGELNQIFELRQKCGNLSILQVLESDLSGIKDVVESGFEVKYDIVEEAFNCMRCMKSEGVCGRKDIDQYQFSCYCPDGSEASSPCQIHTSSDFH